MKSTIPWWIKGKYILVTIKFLHAPLYIIYIFIYVRLRRIIFTTVPYGDVWLKKIHWYRNVSNPHWYKWPRWLNDNTQVTGFIPDNVIMKWLHKPHILITCPLCWKHVRSRLNVISGPQRERLVHGHYCDVIMGAMASQIISLTIVYLTVYSGADQRKQQSSASLAFVRGIHRWPVNSPHKWPATRKMFPFDDIIMESERSQIWTRLSMNRPL